MNKKFIPFAILSAAALLASCGGASSTDSSSSQSSEATSAATSAATSEASSSASSEAISGASSSASSEATSESSSEAVSESSEASKDIYQVVKLKGFDNLTTNFLLTEGLDASAEYAVGSEATFELAPGEWLSEGFDEKTHLEHIFVYVNGVGFHPTFVDSTKLTATFVVPSKDFEVVVCYSVQQHVKEGGYSISLEEGSKGTLYGVLPSETYDYFDCYVKFDTPFGLNGFSYKMGEADWVSVGMWDYDCCFTRVDGRDDVYQITVRPGYGDVTGDVVLRLDGVEKQSYSITYDFGELGEAALDEESSTLPESALNGDMVQFFIAATTDYYVTSATIDVTGTDLISYGGALYNFEMPSSDVVITVTFAEKIDIAVTLGEHIESAAFYNADDIFYGVEITKAQPGDEVYLFVTAEEGYKPTALTVGEESVDFTSYDGGYTFMACLTVPEDATSFEVSPSASIAYTAISADSEVEIMFNGGHVYFEGETVRFSVGVPAGKQIESVSLVDEEGTALETEVTMSGTYGSFTMPAKNVKVVVTFGELSGEYVHVSASYDDDLYYVYSSTDYDWNFLDGFDVLLGSTFYLSVGDYDGQEFFVGIKNGETVETIAATLDEDMGEYLFGRSIVVAGDVEIKVGASEEEVAFETAATAHVSATFDEDVYEVNSSTDYSWDFAAGFDVEIGTTFYLSVYSYDMEPFYVGIKNGENVQVLAATVDEEMGEVSFGASIEVAGDVEIKVGATEADVSFDA